MWQNARILLAAHPPPKEAVLEQPWSPWGHLLHIKLLGTVCIPNLTWPSPKVLRCLTAPCRSSHRRVDIPVLQIPPYGSFIPVFLVTAVQQTTPGGCGLLDLAMAHEELGLASVFFFSHCVREKQSHKGMPDRFLSLPGFLLLGRESGLWR